MFIKHKKVRKCNGIDNGYFNQAKVCLRRMTNDVSLTDEEHKSIKAAIVAIEQVQEAMRRKDGQIIFDK